MCLTIPGRVLSVDSSDPVARVAEVDFGVAKRRVNLLYTPEAEVGSYVLVRAGYATTVMPEAEALEALEYAQQLSEQLANETAEAREAVAGSGSRP